MERITRKDISEQKEFTKYGDTFTQIKNNPETGWWLYKRVSNEAFNGEHIESYEVVRGKPYKNPNGEKVLVYPSESDWGVYGYTIPKCWWAKPTIDFIMERDTISAQEMYEFKKTLKDHPDNPYKTPNKSEIREF